MPLVDNNNTIADVDTAAASAIQDTGVISYNNQDNKDFEDDDDCKDSVDDDMGAPDNRTVEVPNKNLNCVVIYKYKRYTDAETSKPHW